MTDQPRITGLDLATQTGVAYGKLWEKPSFASWNLKAKSHGEKGVKLMRHLTNHVREYQPDKVYIEAPLNIRVLMNIGATADTVLLTNGLVYITMAVLCARSIPYELVDVNAARDHLLGRRPAKGSGKAMVTARCQHLGWKPTNDNESDAAAVWDYGCAQENPRSFVKLAMERPI